MDPVILQIKQKDTCSHKILPQHCSSCQMETFLLCQKENGTVVPKDLYKSVLFADVKEGQKIRTLDLRFSADHEQNFVYGDEGFYDALVPLSRVFVEREGEEENRCHHPRPPQNFEALKKLRIVFVGSQEAYYGFLCCLMSKYGNATTAFHGPELDTDKEIKKGIQLRWQWGGKLDTCVFQNHKEATSYIEVSTGECTQYYSTTDGNQFLAGYKKMLELDIPQVTSRAETEGQMYCKTATHDQECGMCSSNEDKLERGATNTSFAWDRKDPKVEECTAYWYYLEDK